MAETFGDILAEARVSKGLSLEQVSQDLRIRPAILAALEREDYFGMPLKGHSRNMVSAYSRYLGLNSAALTELFLQNYRDFEHSEANLRRGVQRMPITPRNVPSPITPSQARRVREQGLGQGQGQGQGVRSIWDKPAPRSELHSGYDSRSPKTQRSAKSAARRRPVHGAQGSSNPTAVAMRQSGPARAGVGSGLNSSQSGGIASNIAGVVRHLMSSTPLPLILLVIGLVSLLVIWAVIANSCNSQPDTFIPVQTGNPAAGAQGDGGGIDALIPPVGDTGAEAPQYGPFLLKLDPLPGTEPWCSIKVSGTVVFDGTLTSPLSFTVTDNCEVQTGQPDNARVYRNDVLQEYPTVNDFGVWSIWMEVVERPVNDKTTNPPADQNLPDNQGQPSPEGQDGGQAAQ